MVEKFVHVGPMKKHEEYRAIELFKEGKTAEQVAGEMMRTYSVIKSFAKKNLPGFSEETDRVEIDEAAEKAFDILYEFRATPEYKNLRTYWDANEIREYERMWVKLTLQLGRDLPAMEEIQVKELISIHLRMRRNEAASFWQQGEIDRMHAEYNDIKMNEDQNDPAVQMRIRDIRNDIVHGQGEMKRLTSEHKDLSTQYANKFKDMNGTRQQRAKQLEQMESSESIFDMIKNLQNRDVATVEGRKLILRRMAKDKAKAGMMRPHRYVNGEVDLPLLTVETAPALLDLNEIEATALQVENTELKQIETNIDNFPANTLPA